MGSGAGGPRPVASEPGKGSFPLPFPLPDRRAGALTEQTPAGAGRRGRGCCLRHRLAVPPGIPQTPSPRPSPNLLVQPIILLKIASLSALHRTAWDSALGFCRREARTQPPPQVPCTRAALVHFGATVAGITRNHRLPSSSVSKPWQTAGLQPRT